MKARAFFSLLLFTAGFALPVAGLSVQPQDGTRDEFYWLLDDTEESAPGLLPSAGGCNYDPRTSKAYRKMRLDSEAMIEIMRKTVALTKKRIEVAREADTLICIHCMEEKIPRIEDEIRTASSWNIVLANPDNQAVDHLEAYWAIEDAYKKVKRMRAKMDRDWRWGISLD